jgi:hypothetical protein
LLFRDDNVLVRYPGFCTPLVIPREAVRVVAIDDEPSKRFQPNRRFPIQGTLPAESFADALDLNESPPWGPNTGPRPRTFPLPPSPEVPSQGYLYGPDGSSLPFLKLNPEDVPNVALLFHEPLRTPRAPLGLGLTGATVVLAGRRNVHGFLLRAAPAVAAATAFGAWGVVRPITAQDVVEEGLLVPKPLRGVRRVVWTATAAIPLIMKLLLFRHHRF